MGIIPQLSGKIIFGERVEIGYFDQEMTFINNNHSVYDEIKSEYVELSQIQIRSALGAFEFSGDDVEKIVSDLSGGEKVRLMLCKIMLKKPNLLMMDEPTNHLDMIGKESLERILNSYNGTILFVSHDRYFIKDVASSLLVFNNDNVEYYPHGYLEYEEKRNSIDKELDIVDTKNNKKVKDNSSYLDLKNKNKMERRLSKIEDEIKRFEEKIQDLETEMLKEYVYLDRVKSMETQGMIDEINKKIKDLENEWYEISNLII